MQVVWTNKNGRTREGLIAEGGKVVEGRPFKEDDDSFRGGVIFGDLATAIVYGLNADKLFQVEPIGKKIRILLRTEPIEEKEIRILFFKFKAVVEERKIYGNLWKAQKVSIVRELDPVPFLRSLANHPDFWVRKAVAQSSRTDLETLKKLSLDKSGWVLSAVASNPNTDQETLGKLCYCLDSLARSIAIRRILLPLGTLETISKQIKGDALIENAVKAKIKTHRDTSFSTKVKLALLGY